MWWRHASGLVVLAERTAARVWWHSVSGLDVLAEFSGWLCRAVADGLATLLRIVSLCGWRASPRRDVAAIASCRVMVDY